MKKALSILLCLAMLISTVPMAVFAAPSAVVAGDSALELAPEHTEEDGNTAELAADQYTISFTAGRNSKLKDGQTDYDPRYCDVGGIQSPFRNPTTRYESTKAGYVLDGTWTDGTEIYERSVKYAFTQDTVLYPNVVPEGDAYTVKLTAEGAFADAYNGWGTIVVAVGETLDLAEFALTAVEGFPVLGWKNVSTGEIVTSVSGAKDEVIELTVASAAKPVVITYTGATEITVNDGTIELSATVAPANEGDEITSTEVTWSIVGGETNCASLEGNVLKGIFNTSAEGGVIVRATSVYDPSQTADVTIAISGQVAYAVKFDKNTGATVTGMPEDALIKGAYTLPAGPSREGYYFDGWMTSAEGETAVAASYTVTADTTFYAKWTKGGYFNDFSNETGTFTEGQTAALALSDGHSISTDRRYVQNLVAENGYINFTLGGNGNFAGKTDHNDYRMVFSTKSKVDVSKSDKVIIGLRSDIGATISNTVFYATMDENGDWIMPSNSPGNCINPSIAGDGTKYDKNKFNVNFAYPASLDQVAEMVIDLSKHDTWDGYLDNFRIGIIGYGSTYNGKKIQYEYIKIPGVPTVEHVALNVTAPVATEVAYGLEAVEALSDKFIPVSVTWEGADLLGGMYYDSAAAYTVKVEVEAAGAYALSDAPATVTVNGEEAAFVVEDGKSYIVYTFAATEDLGELSIVNVNLHEQNDSGVVTETKAVLAGLDVDLNAITPANVPAGERWMGWALEEDGTAINGIINITEETDYYALYEVIDSYDFANKYHHNAENVKVTDAVVSYDGAWVVVNPKTNDSVANLVLDGMYLSSYNYDFVEVIYDGSLEDENHENKFFTGLVTPALTVYGADGRSYAAKLVKTEPVVASNRVSYKYTYDIITNGRPEVIASFVLAPYKGKPAWAVTSVKLVENTNIDTAVAVTGVKAPETWNLPDVSIEASANYEVVSIDWSGDAFNEDGSYKAGTVYTATIVVKPAKGYVIGVEDATVNGEAVDSATLNDDGSLTIVKAFPATEALTEFDITVEDDVIDVADGTVKLVPVFTPEIENMEVTWEIVENGDIAEINAKTGVVKAFFDGIVTVRATSKYNPEKYADATVTISNQVLSYTVIFDKNTNANVTGMPAEAQAKLGYTLPKTAPVREGFMFVGWSKSKGSKTYIEKDYVTGPVTYYANWSKDGYIVNFDNDGDTQSSATVVRLADGGTFSTDARYASDVTLDTENGYVSMKLGGTAGHYGDFRFQLTPPDGTVDISNVEGFVVGLRADAAGSVPFLIRYATKDENGNWIGPNDTTDANTYIANSFWTSAVSFSGDVNEVVELVVDMSEKGAWDGYLNQIRICINNHSAMLGKTLYVDYIRAINYETDVVEITGVDAPVAKNIPDTTAVAKDASKYVVTNVAWEGGLLYDYYFGGSTEYTVCVTVKGAPGYFVSNAPSTVKINGKNAEVDSYNNATGELTIKYTFPATAVLENPEAFDLELYGDPDAEPEIRTIFYGDSFALGSYMPTNVPEGMRWVGWVDEDGNTVTGSIVVDGDKTFYAAFEEITGFDYSNYYHQIGTVAKGEDVLSFEDGLAVLRPIGKGSNVSLVTPAMNIDGSDFGLVEVYYNAILDATYGVNHYDNIFSATLKPALTFSLMSSPDNLSHTAKLVGAKRVMVDGKSYYKYTYDMTATPAWSGNVAKLCADPYNGYPLWGIGHIKLVPNEVTDAVAEIEVASPEAWAVASAPVIANEEYEIVSANWSPAAETFALETEYTLTVTYKTVAGFKVEEATAAINGEEVEVTDNGNDTYTVSYTFEETEGIKATEVVISGADEITSKGRYIQLTGETVALDGSELPVTGVTWSIESVGDAELAKISEKGRVYPISNGTVIVTATSVYDPTVSATHEITISNQADLVKVTFDKNTQAEVEGDVFNEEVYVYGSFVPEAYNISREGFYFMGWSTDEDALQPSASFNITEDTVLYAKWGKGFELNFNDAANAPTPIGLNVLTFEGTKPGTGKLIYNNTSKNAGQVFTISGLYPYALDTAVYNKLEIGISLPFNTGILTFYHNGDGVTTGGFSANYQHRSSATYAKNNPGEFQTAVVDYSTTSKWTEAPFVDAIRLDFVNAPQGEVIFDYIRLPNPNRTVKLDGNGGLISYLGGEVASYKSSHKIGNIPLPDATREGYDFLGWAKKTEDYTKLYNNKFPVSDDVTLYAIWGEEGSAGDGEGEGSSVPSNSDATTSKGGPAQHPGHITYPSLGGGTISSPAATNTKTPDDKKVNVPARPKDDGPLAMGAGNMLPEKFKPTAKYDKRFKDIKTTNWFYKDIEKSFNLGLMNGKSANAFDPDGSVTIAEALAVAARMNAIYYGRAVYGATGAQWYVPYVDYAVANSIITAGQFGDFKTPATREQVSQLFIKALPASWYPAKNMFSSIPDVAAGTATEEMLLKLYNAGIFTGVDDAYNFKPNDNIKRSELSAIINRVALPDSRLRVITPEELALRSKVFTAEDIIANSKNMTVANSVENKFKLKNGGAWAEPAKADPWSGGWNTLFKEGFVNADEFKTITVVIKPDDPAAVVGAGGSKFYFAFDGKYSDAVSVATKVTDPNEDGTITLVYDMSQHAMWAGEVTTLRYDPYDNATPYAIVSITFAP